MRYTQLITKEQRAVLNKARETYGYQKQLSVCSEELNELSIVCNKHCRYDTPEKASSALHKEALTEVADVLIILDHVVNIFGIEESELASRIAGKIERLNRWMSETDSLEQSTIDRTVIDPNRDCEYCLHKAVPRAVSPCKDCGPYKRNFMKAVACKGCVNYGAFKNLSPGGVCLTCLKDGGSQYRPVEEVANASE